MATYKVIPWSVAIGKIYWQKYHYGKSNLIMLYPVSYHLYAWQKTPALLCNKPSIGMCGLWQWENFSTMLYSFRYIAKHYHEEITKKKNIFAWQRSKATSIEIYQRVELTIPIRSAWKETLMAEATQKLWVETLINLEIKNAFDLNNFTPSWGMCMEHIRKQLRRNF